MNLSCIIFPTWINFKIKEIKVLIIILMLKTVINKFNQIKIKLIIVQLIIIIKRCILEIILFIIIDF